MSDLYFIRHGQAGTRLNYDALSDLGHLQCRLLGEYLARQAITFSNIITGGLQRHRETAASVLEAYQTDGVGIAQPVIDTGWNEFDLDKVYQSIAPQLSKDDAAFAAAYDDMQRQIDAHGAVPQAVINRRWNPCDSMIVKAWVTARYPVQCQTWAAFRSGIEQAFSQLAASNPEGNVAIFTSATPTAIALGQIMDLSEHKMFNLAGVMINSAISVIRQRDGEVRVFNFNTVPHLDDASMRTHR